MLSLAEERACRRGLPSILGGLGALLVTGGVLGFAAGVLCWLQGTAGPELAAGGLAALLLGLGSLAFADLLHRLRCIAALLGQLTRQDRPSDRV